MHVPQDWGSRRQLLAGDKAERHPGHVVFDIALRTNAITSLSPPARCTHRDTWIFWPYGRNKVKVSSAESTQVRAALVTYERKGFPADVFWHSVLRKKSNKSLSVTGKEMEYSMLLRVVLTREL